MQLELSRMCALKNLFIIRQLGIDNHGGQLPVNNQQHERTMEEDWNSHQQPRERGLYRVRTLLARQKFFATPYRTVLHVRTLSLIYLNSKYPVLSCGGWVRTSSVAEPESEP